MPEITLPGGISVDVGTTKPDWPTFCQDHSIKKELKLLVVKSPDNSSDAWQNLADKLTEQVTSEYGVDPKINYRYIQLDSVNIIVFTALYTRYQQYSTVDGETKADNVFFDEATYNEYKAYIDAILASISVTPIDPFAEN